MIVLSLKTYFASATATVVVIIAIAIAIAAADFKLSYRQISLGDSLNKVPSSSSRANLLADSTAH